MSTVCSTKNTTVGTSTSYSATCDPRTSVRCGILSWRMVLGTSITCSATKSSDMSVIFRTSTTGPPYAAQEHRGSAPGARNPRSVPLAGRPRPPLGVFLVVQLEERLGTTGFCRRGAWYFVSCPSSLALVAVVLLCGAPYSACTLPYEWCIAVATVMRTVCCSCLSVAEQLPRALRQTHPSLATQKNCLSWVVVVVVVVVRTTLQMCLCQQHRSSNWQTPGAESPGSKLPATPAPPAPVSDPGAPKNPNPGHTSQPRPVSVQSGCPPNRR